jgi:hypothetical protein
MPDLCGDMKANRAIRPYSFLLAGSFGSECFFFKQPRKLSGSPFLLRLFYNDPAIFLSIAAKVFSIFGLLQKGLQHPLGAGKKVSNNLKALLPACLHINE